MRIDYRYKSAGKEYASRQLNRNPKNPLLTMFLEEGSSKMEFDMSVSEARELAEELLSYANDIEEYAKVLKRMEVVANG